MMTEMQNLARRMLQETEVTHPLLGLWRYQVLNGTGAALLPAMESISPEAWLDYYTTVHDWEGYTVESIMEHIGERSQAGYGTKLHLTDGFELAYPEDMPRDSKLIDTAVKVLAGGVRFDGDAELADTIFWFHDQLCDAYAMREED